MNIETKLNPKQYAAASSSADYLRIIAGAGTGKTRTLSYRIAYLIDQGMKPNRMVAITFTNKAAKEMLQRVTGILQTESDRPCYALPLISTFHGFCYRFLKKEIIHIPGYNNQFSVLDTQDQNAIYKLIFKGMTKGASKEFVHAIVSKISSLKNDGYFSDDVPLSEIPTNPIYTAQELLFVYREYQKNLRLQNMLDFDDLLMLTTKIMHQCEDVRTVWQNKFDIFLVDEFQDTNLVQYDMVKLFMRKADSGLTPTRLTVVGDPDQTIYTWRGAQNDIIKERLQRDFHSLETVVLDDNYRSTQNILNAANNLIRHNKDRMAKDLHAASNQQGEPVRYAHYASGDNEAYAIASQIRSMVMKNEYNLKDIAVIYRANYLSNALEKQLAAFKIPYQIYGGLKFYERAEIKDALSYLRAIINPDDLSFQRIINAPSKGIGEKTLEKARLMKHELGEETSLFTIFKDHPDDLRLTSRSRLALTRFYTAYQTIEDIYHSNPDTATLLSAIKSYFIATGFSDYVYEEDKKNQERTSFTASSSTSKVDNVNEFIRSLTEALDTPILDEEGNSHDSTLEDFLISVALQSDQDTMEEGRQVSLMTGHVSKGLEFPVVFVTGVNQTIFPSYHALTGDGKASIEEERRLFYVACTRAQKRLYVSSFGGVNFRTGSGYQPSMFIKELGIEEKKEEEKPINTYYASCGTNRPTSGNMARFSQKDKTMIQGISQAGSLKQNSTSIETYEVGDKIIHITFGKGEVIEVNGNKIKVKFQNSGEIKTMLIGFKAYRKLKEDE